jgi:hypothetical protein
MAGRPMNRLHQDDVRFYVYDVLGSDGEVIYVGKGSGNRHKVSCRVRGGIETRIIERFSSESAAYAFEVKRIAEMKPRLNVSVGGNGCRASLKREGKTKWQKTFERIGSKKYAAMLLLSCFSACARGGIKYPGDLSKIDEIREIAYG